MPQFSTALYGRLNNDWAVLGQRTEGGRCMQVSQNMASPVRSPIQILTRLGVSLVGPYALSPLVIETGFMKPTANLHTQKKYHWGSAE